MIARLSRSSLSSSSKTQFGTVSSPRELMIPTSEIALLLRGWRDSKRRLRVVALLDSVHLASYCMVSEVKESSFSVILDADGRNMVEFFFEGWVFDFTEAPPDGEELLMGGIIESSIVGLRSGYKLMLLLLEDES